MANLGQPLENGGRRGDVAWPVERLDRFLPEAEVRERHSIAIQAPARLVFETARRFDLRSIRAVAAVLRLRAWFLGSQKSAGPRMGLVEETRRLGWGVLEDQDGRYYCAGAVCQPWLPDVTFRAVPPADFPGCREPDFVKIAWTLEVLPIGDERTRFSTETRAAATDEGARRKFLRYWKKVRPGVLLIRICLLRALRRSAERTWRDSRARVAV
jgi:hypothetical protein